MKTKKKNGQNAQTGYEAANQLQTLIEKATGLPVWSATGPATVRAGMTAAVGSYGKSKSDIETWIALRESDRDRLKGLLGWPADRDYRVDPLADRISQAFADLLFGEDPEFTAADAADQDADHAKRVEQTEEGEEPPPPKQSGDQERLDEIIEENELPSELRRSAADCSSEGEIWWRIYTDPLQADVPLVEFHSRLDVVPLFRGRHVVACAFISHLATQEIKSSKNQVENVHWRHIEIQATGMTRNLLYRGNVSTLGTQQPLTAFDETSELPEEWVHGLDVMLAGRIVNKLGRDYRLGLSDYQGIKDLLLDLNEARTIMAENARLTAKSRMVVPIEAIRDGKFDAGADVIVHEALDATMGSDKAPGPYAVLQYTFEAESLKTHINELRSAAITGVGLMEQFVGMGSGHEGDAGLSGTALRTRLIPTTLAAQGRGRYWDAAVPEILRRMQLVDQLPVNKGGFGTKWSKADEAPAVERSSVLPEDPAEEVSRHVEAVGGEIESTETAVRSLHPDWSEDEIKKELEKIKEGRAPEPSPFNGGRLPGEDEQEVDPKTGLPIPPKPPQPPRRPPPPPAGSGQGVR